MTIVCSSCQRYLGTLPPFHDKGVTHSLCSPCAIRERRELKTLVLSRERADTLPVLSSLFRPHGDVKVVLDRRRIERRQERIDVDPCRRGGGRDRRQTRSLRLV